MNVKIQNIKDVTVKGVNAVFSDSYKTVKENYLEWTPFPLFSTFKASRVMTGLLQAWHHTPDFPWAERHDDNEIFYFMEGGAIMLFIDYKDDAPDFSTAQIVRIPQGTTLEIEKGKGHCVGVAEGETYKVIVVSPEQPAPKVYFDEPISGVE